VTKVTVRDRVAQLAPIARRESAGAIAAHARNIRRSSLRMAHAAGLGHPGGDLSSADILATLYFHVLRVDPREPRHTDRDRFILSKGHASGALYATLAEAGFLPEAALEQYMKPLSNLNGHPDRNKVAGVEANTGPLGHGLPIAVGVALGARLQGAAWRTFVLTGDGELQEGANWEAAMSASHFQLDQLAVIVDRNGLQQGARTEETIALEPLEERWRAFGFAVACVDGHDIAALTHVLDNVPLEAHRPSCIIARTTKGRGVSFMQDRAEWHHRIPTLEELTLALVELEADL
jgi:transketolase